MKKKYIIAVLSIFLLCSCNENAKNEAEIAKLPFSSEYGFASRYWYKDKETSYEFENLIKNELNSQGFSNWSGNGQMYHSAYRSYKDSMYFFYQTKKDNHIAYAAIQINVFTKKVNVFDYISLQYIKEKGLVEESFDEQEAQAVVVDGFSDILSFRITLNDINKRLQFTYDTVTLERIYEGEYVKNPEYNPKKINDDYYIFDGTSVYGYNGSLFLHVIDAEGNTWNVIETLIKTDICKKIFEIYDKGDFGYSYFILDEELYFEMEFDNSSLFDLNPTISATMIFKADFINQSVDYLGYLPTQNLLYGIFKL